MVIVDGEGKSRPRKESTPNPKHKEKSGKSKKPIGASEPPGEPKEKKYVVPQDLYFRSKSLGAINGQSHGQTSNDFDRPESHT